MRGHNNLMGYCNGTRAQSWRTTRFGRKKLHGCVFHGRLAWRNGRWHHATRNGRFGWWWDVGGIWYFYPDKIDGPPDYASTIRSRTMRPPPRQIRPPPQNPTTLFIIVPESSRAPAIRRSMSALARANKPVSVSVC